MKKWGIIILCASFLAILAQPVLADYSIDDLPGLSDPLTISVQPENPAPNTPVTVEVRSFSLNLDASTIAWTINGTSQGSAVGKTKVTSSTGASGSSFTATATVTTPDGKTYRKDFSIKPATVDLIWEARSFVPPFYKGKALLPYQGELDVQAMPALSGSTVSNPKTLLYTWKSNNEVIGGASGYGKDTLSITLNGIVIQPMVISVVVTDTTNSVVASNQVVITPMNPQITFYADSPLYGRLYNTALSTSYKIPEKELVLNAVPYYFSTNDNHQFAGDFIWNVNGSNVVTTNNGTERLLIRTPDGVTGNSMISLQTTSSKKLLQSANNQISISYTAQ
jgi:hypothetical protein